MGYSRARGGVYLLMNKKQTKTQKLLLDCYDELKRETGDVPTVQEVQQRFKEKYGNK
jgi:hypothetical protein